MSTMNENEFKARFESFVIGLLIVFVVGQALFILLKIIGYFEYSWWVVFIPFFVECAVCILCLTVALLVSLVLHIETKLLKRKIEKEVTDVKSE